MADERGYACLLDLCRAWAAEANAPKELILRRVIEWAVEGTFPPESFLTVTGDNPLPAKMLAAFRAVYAPPETYGLHLRHDGLVTIGSLSLRIPRDQALEFLADVVVSLESVQRFCDSMGITTGDPPPACPRLAELEAADFAATGEADERAEAVLGKSGAERRCQAWLEGLMKGRQKPGKAKDAYRKDAKGLFKGLSVRGFDRAWANAITSTGNECWSKRGRKS